MNYLETPILFIVFNRPETTSRVFEVIRKMRPTRLFVAADGPRRNKEKEQEKCDEVRSIVKQVDWNCDVNYLFREANLGCGNAVNQSINWFFEHVQEGIILEDDCLPNSSFFYYCQELLSYHRENEDVMMISGNNILNKTKGSDSYDFVRTCNIWGWATWKRAWTKYDFNMGLYDRSGIQSILEQLNYVQPEQLEKILNDFDSVEKQLVDTWDFQWQFCILYYKGLVAWPHNNMVKNIGFGADATHTKYEYLPEAFLETFEMEFPMRHPKSFTYNLDVEQQIFTYIANRRERVPIVRRIKNFLRKGLNLALPS